MAGRVPSISRRRVLGAAAAVPVLLAGGPSPAAVLETPPPDAPSPALRLWRRRLARYRRLAAAAEEAAERGWFREANARHDREREACRGMLDAEALRAAAWERLAAAEDAYWERCTDPMQKAAVALATTPAPGLDAVREKIAVMRKVRLHELDSMERDCFDLLLRDLERLSPSPTPYIPAGPQ